MSLLLVSSLGLAVELKGQSSSNKPKTSAKVQKKLTPAQASKSTEAPVALEAAAQPTAVAQPTAAAQPTAVAELDIGSKVETPVVVEDASSVKPSLAQGTSDELGEATLRQDALLEQALAFDPTQAEMSTLDSGLKVVWQKVPGEAQVSVCTTVQIGANSDPKNQPGSASALAEILKEGGYRSRSQDYKALVQRRGLKNQVDVKRSTTTYCTSGPASELALALWVTGGRFTAGGLAQEALDSAVELLYNRVEADDKNIFSGRAKSRLRSLAYLGAESLGHHSEGHLASLSEISLSSLRALHREAYVGRRATVSIVGGFESEQLAQMLTQHLGKVREGQLYKSDNIRRIEQKTSRFSMAEDPAAKSPAVWYGWVVDEPGAIEATAAALSIAINEKRLGRELLKGSAPAVGLNLHLERGSNLPLFALAINSRSNKSFTRIEGKLRAQLRTLASNGPSKSELEEFRQQASRDAKASLATDQLRARELSWGVTQGRSPEQVLAPLSDKSTELDLTIDAVRQAARTILSERKRVAVEVYPKGWRDPWQTPMPHYHVVSRGETLGAIALKYGSTVPAIIKMNGRKTQQSIYPGDKLRVPRVKNAKKAKPARHHVVRRGDTLGALALKYSISSRQIAAANGIGKSGRITSGQKLRIPWGKKSPKSASKKAKKSQKAKSYSSYKVRRGDALSTIARRFKLSTKELAALNTLGSSTMVKVGQVLKVPAGVAQVTPKLKTKKTVKPKIRFVWYKVRSGDTLSGIAKRHGVTVTAIERLNGMNRKTRIFAGKKLKLPKK